MRKPCLYDSLSARTQDNPNVEYTISLPKLSSQRLSVTYVPASDSDAVTLENYSNSGNPNFPIYIYTIDLKPQIQLDDQIVAQGTAALPMGSYQYIRITLTDPHNNHQEHAQASVGDLIVFGVNGNGISKNLIDHRLAQISPDSSPAESMHATALFFWGQHDLADKAAAANHGIYRLRMPSVGTFSIPLSVRYGFGGIPTAGSYGERRLDVTWNAQTVVAPDQASLYDYMNQAGIQGSYLEGFVLDQLFGATHHPARSAAQALIEATEQQIPINTLTLNNIADILP